jgi:hypothetical protein
MAPSAIDSPLDFNASATIWMGKIQAVAFGAFAFGIALLKISLPSRNVGILALQRNASSLVPLLEKLIFKGAQNQTAARCTVAVA